MKQDFETEELKDELERALGFRLRSLGRLDGARALNFKAVSSVYALVDAGAIGYMNKGRGRKRYCVFPRESVLMFLQRRCNQI